MRIISIKLISYLAIGFLTLSWSLSSCQKALDEVVESAYLDPILPEPQYKFSRNGYSSVNTLECELLKAPIDRIYTSYLKVADLSNDELYRTMYSFYNSGEFGQAPQTELAQSKLIAEKREQIEQDIQTLFNTTKDLSGYGADRPSDVRNRHARTGRSGLIGRNLGDDNKFFVDPLGVAPAEVYRYYVLGAVYLDKVLNQHIYAVTQDADLRNKHEQQDFLDGSNYTALEHHWDLAYGYYKMLTDITAADGLPILKDTHRQILYAFIEGRRAMNDFHYHIVDEQAKIIRRELSRAFAVRAIYALQGPNTLANLHSGSNYIFLFASQAIGLMHCLPFTLQDDGTARVKYDDIKGLITSLTASPGLWDKDRIAAGVERDGSFAHIAQRIAEIYQINLADIKR